MGFFSKPLLTQAEQAEIVDAVKQAEAKTSGEIKVHVEARCTVDPMDRAKKVFSQLGLHKTAERNGVLIYVALRDKRFAILGDSGIDAKVPQNFWTSTAALMQQAFAAGKMTAGIAAGVAEAGTQLALYFPHQANDTNELDDSISMG